MHKCIGTSKAGLLVPDETRPLSWSDSALCLLSDSSSQTTCLFIFYIQNLYDKQWVAHNTVFTVASPVSRFLNCLKWWLYVALTLPVPVRPHTCLAFLQGFSQSRWFCSQRLHFFLTGGTVTAQQLSGPQGRCGTVSGKSLLAGVKMDHSWGCCLLREQRPTGQKQSTAGWVQPIPATTHLNLQLIFKQYFAITKKLDECWLCLSTLPSCLS